MSLARLRKAVIDNKDIEFNFTKYDLVNSRVCATMQGFATMNNMS